MVATVQLAVVAGAGLPHLPEDFQPAVCQAAQRAGVALSALAVILIVGLGPGALVTAAIGPQVQGLAQVAIATAAELDPMDLPALEADRGGASDAL